MSAHKEKKETKQDRWQNAKDRQQDGKQER